MCYSARSRPPIGRRVLILIGLALVILPSGSRAAEISAAEAYAITLDLAHEVERLRIAMGAQKFDRVGFRVQNAAPRQVYDQTVLLVGRVDQLAREQTGTRPPPMNLARPGSSTPGDVYQLVRHGRDLVREIRDGYGATPGSPSPRRIDPAIDSSIDPSVDPTKGPTEIYNQLLQIGRQLDLMLENRLTPKDNYVQVEMAHRRAAGLLRQAGIVFIPNVEAVPLPTRHTPGDVYRALLVPFAQVERLLEREGETALGVDSTGVDLDAITPAEIHQLSTLIVSELSHLVSRKGAISAPIRRSNQTQSRSPAHVLESVRDLERCLTLLEGTREPVPAAPKTPTLRPE